MTKYIICDESDFVPIPKEFYSLETDAPFSNCLLCDAPLLEPESNLVYQVERVFQGAEPILEYAMCFACCEATRNELSLDSARKIEMFFDEHIDMEIRTNWIKSGDNPGELQSWIDRCAVTKIAANEVKRKRIMALFQGDKLVLPTSMMLSGTAISMVMSMLSKKSQEYLGEFTELNFGMPPEFCDSPNSSPTIF